MRVLPFLRKHSEKIRKENKATKMQLYLMRMHMLVPVYASFFIDLCPLKLYISLID